MGGLPYDPGGDIFGDGPIHYLVEVGYLVSMAWESNDSGLMVVNPITRFDLDGLDELGAEEAWTILRMPKAPKASNFVRLPTRNWQRHITGWKNGAAKIAA